MIVIATNNGMPFLPRLLESIERFGREGEKLCVVDTGSTDHGFLDYLWNSVAASGVTVLQTPYRGYDSGAYIWAYRHFPNEEAFLFLQDSTEVLGSGWVESFRERSTAGFCAYCGFPKDSDARVYLRSKGIPEGSLRCAPASYGTFGPIFFIKSSALVAMDKAFGLDRVIPINKSEQMAMERVWSYMLEASGGKFACLTASSPGGSLYDGIVLHPSLKKYLPVRS